MSKKTADLYRRVRGDEEDLTGQLAFKMNPNKKKKYVDFCVKHNVSMGKVLRIAIDKIMIELIDEIESKEK